MGGNWDPLRFLFSPLLSLFLHPSFFSSILPFGLCPLLLPLPSEGVLLTVKPMALMTHRSTSQR